MKINEFSKKTGLSPRAIRLYEDKGLIHSKRDSRNRYRVYSHLQISLGKKINQFRALGFSVKAIADLLKSSPNLEIEDLKENIRLHLIRLNFQTDETKSKISETKNFIGALKDEKPLTKKQLQLFEGFSHAVLRKSANDLTLNYLKREKQGHDEELQMVASSYAHLFLTAAAQGAMKEFSSSHKLIAKCLHRIGEDRLAKRHLKLALAYSKM